MKLLLFLSHNGVVSRRKAFDCIRNGAVSVNDEVVVEPSATIDPIRDRVAFHGKPVVLKKFEYILLHKPHGYVTTCEGQFDQRTVMDLLPKELQHVRPVGRLDKETEGLLLLTNDGELAHKMMHPAFDVDKTYLARVRWRFTPQKAERLEKGIEIDEEMTAPAKVKILSADMKESEIEITIHEGRKHQVRLMADAVGHPVIYLKRLRQGALVLGNLRSGDWRRLTDEEYNQLQTIKPQERFVPQTHAPRPTGFRGRRQRPQDRRSPGSYERRREDRLNSRYDPRNKRPQNGRQAREEKTVAPAVAAFRPDRTWKTTEQTGERRAYGERTGASRKPYDRRPVSPKPLFSSNSPERRFSSTREWHSETDAHRPVKKAMPRREAPAARDREGRDETGRRDYRSYRPEGRSDSRRDMRRDGRRDDRPGAERGYESRSGFSRDAQDRRPRSQGAAFSPDAPQRRDERGYRAHRPERGSGDRRDDRSRSREEYPGRNPGFSKPAFEKKSFGSKRFGSKPFGKKNFSKKPYTPNP